MKRSKKRKRMTIAIGPAQEPIALTRPENLDESGVFLDAGLEAVVRGGSQVFIYLKSGNSITLSCIDVDHAMKRYEELHDAMAISAESRNITDLNTIQAYLTKRNAVMIV